MSDHWKDDFFERYLTSLSPQAFDCVIALGVRDADSLFLVSDEKLTSDDIPPKIKEEILCKTRNLQGVSIPQNPAPYADKPQSVLPKVKRDSYIPVCSESILSQSLAKLAAIDEESDIWNKPLSLYVDASENIWHHLASVCIFPDDPMECVLSMRLSYLLSLDIGSEIFDMLINACGVLYQECYRYVETRTFREIAKPICQIHIENMLIEFFQVTPDVLERAHSYGWKRWSDFLDLSEEKILNRQGFSIESLSCIVDAYQLLGMTMQIQDEFFVRPEFCISPETMFKEFIPEKFSERTLNVLMQRRGIGNNKPQTLEEVGQKIGVTRERVRQIEVKGLRVINGKKGLKQKARQIASCYHFVAPLLERRFFKLKGVLSIDEAVNCFTDIMGWICGSQRDYQILDFILRFILPYDSEENLYVDVKHPCVSCLVLTNELKELFEKDNRERSYKEIFDYLSGVCVRGKCQESSLPFTKTFLRWILRKEKDIVVDEYTVCHSTTWSTRKGSRVRQVETVLSEYKRPMHFQEIYDILKVKYPHDPMLTSRNVHGALTRENGPFLLWDRGVYVHQKYVSFPRDLVATVEKWLVDRLNKIDSPMIMVGAAWMFFEKECLGNGLISEYALYTCLRIYASDQLVYPKYPQIYLRENFQTRIPYTFVIEDYVAQNGGILSSESLRFFAIDTLGLKEYQLQQGLAKMYGIFRKADGEYVSVKINFDLLKTLNAHIVSLVQSLGTISVGRILEDKSITCEQAGASDPVILYNALKTIIPDEIDYPGYPHISCAGEKNIKGLYGQVLEWLKEKGEPCSWSELEDFFVQERKYNENTLRSALQREEVFRYAQGVFVHRDTLGITHDVEQMVKRFIQNEFKRSLSIGEYFSLISDVLINQPLPDLENDMLWTKTLLAHVIDSMQDAKILGSARNAFICFPHPSYVETFEDLIYILLREREGGACLLKDFELYLRKEEIIAKELTVSMLHNQEKVAIQDGVLFIKDAYRP